MRRDDLYLKDIILAADAIAGFLGSRQAADFVDDDLLRSAVLQKLTIIGEAAARLSDEFKQKNTTVPWRDVVAFRNIAVHRYFSIDWQIVWNTATVDVPSLRGEILKCTMASGEDS